MRKKLLIAYLLICFFIMISTISYAGSISISSSKSTVAPGESFTVTVSGNDATGRVNVSGGNASPSSQWIENNSVTFTATAPQSGSVTITASGEFADSQGVDFSDSKSVTVSVTQPTPEPSSPTQPTEPEKPAEPVISNNANLSNLGINPKEYDFKGFKASKTAYEVTVPNEVASIEIYANKQDSKASIKGTGKKDLQEGTNVFKIEVTAESGKQKVYQLNVIRKVASSEIDPNIGNTADTTGENIVSGLSKLEIQGKTLTPEFSVSTYRYIVELEEDEILTLEQVKKLIITEVNFEGGTFEIIGDDNLDKEENEVVISVKDADGREIAIYTIVFKLPKEEDTTDTSDENIVIIKEENRDDLLKGKIIIISTIVVISLIAIKSSITSYKQRKILKANGLIKQKEEYDETDEEIIEEADNETEIIEETVEKEVKEENDYIKDIFENNQMEFNPDEKDFIKKKRKKGKHS